MKVYVAVYERADGDQTIRVFRTASPGATDWRLEIAVKKWADYSDERPPSDKDELADAYWEQGIECFDIKTIELED